MKPVRLWATTTPEIYKQMLIYLATTVNKKNGSKVKLGEFIEMAVIEKLERENKRLEKKRKTSEAIK